VTAQRSSETSSSSGKSWLAYASMLAVAGAFFMAVRTLGQGLSSSGPGVEKAAQSPVQTHTLFHVLLALLVVIGASRALGILFKKIHQPAVIGETVAGIALGPSLLGRIAPDVASYLFPQNVVPLLGVLAHVGVIVFMFLVGIELDTSILRKKTHQAMAISHASIIAPFLLGTGLALWIYPSLAPRAVKFDVFALFMGVAMSITAFPVLARILTDRGMHRTRLGTLALSCAAVDDVTAWCLLALVVGVANSAASSALVTIGLTMLFIAVMFFAVRPLVHRAVRAQEVRAELSRDSVGFVLVGLLVSALVAEYIGIHAIFGAFLVGALIPHDSRLGRALEHKLGDLVVVFLLPAFFAVTGLRTQMGLLDGSDAWLMCGAIITVACAGKVGGTYTAARLSKIAPRDAASLGVLMNTRGLMELVVLNVGLDLGVISPALFAMMVLMAVITTFMTSPMLSWIQRDERVPEGEPASAG
jgi:Kef-type K+ transport system membrane component KefB